MNLCSRHFLWTAVSDYYLLRNFELRENEDGRWAVRVKAGNLGPGADNGLPP